MRDFASITEDEVKAVYQQTPEVNLYHSWESVKNCEPMYIALKNKIIAHEQENNMDYPKNVKPLFAGIDAGTNAPVTHVVPTFTGDVTFPKKENKNTDEVERSTITLNKNQISQVRNAIKLARNCLMTNLGEQIKEEAIQELGKCQSMINAFHKKQVKHE